LWQQDAKPEILRQAHQCANKKEEVKSMKTKLIAAISILVVFLASLGFIVPVSAISCTTVTTGTRFSGMTAAYINTGWGSDVNALGCQIGIYVNTAGSVISGVSVHDASYFGIAVDTVGSVTVTGSTVYNIGDHTGALYTPTGAQHGVAIYYYASFGTISSNIVHDYQKGGITANLAATDGGSVLIQGNTVTGAGRIDYIAQNGIQLGWGARGEISGNTVTGNWYQPILRGNGKAIGQQPWVSAGILLYDINMSNIKVFHNELRDNQFNMLVITSASLGDAP
jgi:hypothetical protein